MVNQKQKILQFKSRLKKVLESGHWSCDFDMLSRHELFRFDSFEYECWAIYFPVDNEMDIFEFPGCEFERDRKKAEKIFKKISRL